MNTPRFARRKNSFHADLKKQINQYFTENKIGTTGDFRLYFKAILLTTALLATYIHVVFFTPATWIAILECLFLGALTAGIGFNVMHDGAHGSFSSKKWINKMAGLSLNFLGANIFMWNAKHNIIHHTYTNVADVDDDLDARPFLRLCETQKKYKMHNYQHWYFWLAYSMLYIYWIFVSDYIKYFKGRIGDIPIKKMTVKDHISFWSFKLLHAAVFVVLPIIFVGFTGWLIGFLIYAMFTGLLLSIVFQLAHTVEDCHFPLAQEETNHMEDEWAVHQLKTTANFATQNKMISWMLGGLNFQIEHHLFPNISHVHYPKISRIIKNVCAEYNIPYIEYPKMRIAVVSHVAHLRKMGRV